MGNKLVQDLYKELTAGLTERDFLKKMGLSRKTASGLIDKKEWEEKLTAMLEKGRISCAEALELCRRLVEAVCPEGEPQQGWLPFTYRFIMRQAFPESIEMSSSPKQDRGARLYLKALSILLGEERRRTEFDRKLDFAFLSPQELASSDKKEEYLLFQKTFQEQYIYELMRIGGEIMHFQSLHHVARVHFVAMHAARQLKEAGTSIDLGLVSAAAAGHDIGKYGCRPEESHRIPYLHYYYTDQWFSQNGMSSIGHIAANHSTWDLELENLSVESLILIYADFRVKQSREKPAPGEKEHIVIYSLTDSFDVILQKLDNVDGAKRDRYVHVYHKLKDFEEYMEGLGVHTDLETKELSPRYQKDPALFTVEETVRALKHTAIAHNIEVMHRLGGDTSFARVQEAARSEKDWKNSRAYLNIFEEYFTYMTQRQKLLTLRFLYELLMHREGDIRRQAGTLLGNIIVHYDEKYRKELPQGASGQVQKTGSLELWEDYLNRIVYPDHKVTDQHKRWIGYSLKRILEAVLTRCRPEDRRAYAEPALQLYRQKGQDDSTLFILLDSMRLIPLELCQREELEQMQSFAAELSRRRSVELRAGALVFWEELCRRAALQVFPSDWISEELTDQILNTSEEEGEISLLYLKGCICTHLGIDSQRSAVGASPESAGLDGSSGSASMSETAQQTQTGKAAVPGGLIGKDHILSRNPELISDLFLVNLKAATPWIIKEVNISLFLELLARGNRDHVLHIATHFSNLLKVSERIVVRHRAGEALVEIAPLLSMDQRNEIAIELTRGLELGEYQFSKYIPQYLGKFALYLRPLELEELLMDVGQLLYSRNDRVSSVALVTLGVLIQNYGQYRRQGWESSEDCQRRFRRILGMLLAGYANNRETVRQEATLVLGKMIFGDEALSEQEKEGVFSVICKKLLTLADPQDKGEISFFNRAASLNHIYRFLSDYLFSHNSFAICQPERVAFFPGTFDPFSVSHKGIVKAIRDLGFEVYLALDEFSWSKNTEPRMIRRQIIQMSIANEESVNLFPDGFPVNISNPENLRDLVRLFPGRKVYMVVGSDVVEHASAYRAAPSNHSVHQMNHIVFRRDSRLDGEDGEAAAQQSCDMILGEVILLSLPVHLENVSSTRIRENIDHNRDISNLIDPAAQNFIYSHSLYLREYQFKPMLCPKGLHFEVETGSLDELAAQFAQSPEEETLLRDSLFKPGTKAVLMRAGAGNAIQGAAVFRPVRTRELYGQFQSTALTNFIRDNTSGQIILILGIFTDGQREPEKAMQLLLTEMLAHCLARDFTYAVYDPVRRLAQDPAAAVLKRQGFFPVLGGDPGEKVYAVDMKRPVSLHKNIDSVIKEPFQQNERVQEQIHRAHIRLQTALTQLYPGNLVLSFDSQVMDQHLLSLITAANHVSEEPARVRKLGNRMCVPFGAVLRKVVVPNTVTKALHTEKAFDTKIEGFDITEAPFYGPLETQIRTIRAFDRPVILVDDLLHKGYRIKKLDPLLNREQVNVDKIIVGILSGRGKDLMEIQNRRVESAYFLPSLRSWFVESTIYPFIGGDLVSRPSVMKANLLPSVNFILPYMSAGFLSDAPREAVYRLSMTCLENARDLLLTLEEEYQKQYERSLTLKRLGEVLIVPRVPDKGSCLRYDYNLPASSYVEHDIEDLIRLRNFVRTERG